MKWYFLNIIQPSFYILGSLPGLKPLLRQVVEEVHQKIEPGQLVLNDDAC